jgi:hypothetical protein
MDYFFRELHSEGNRPGGDRPWKHSELDRIADAYRLATEDEDRISLLKEWQLFNADFMPQIPGVDHFTFYTVRWPWLHNTAHGEEGLSEVATQLWGRPRLGSHLVWLDQNMPNRDG